MDNKMKKKINKQNEKKNDVKTNANSNIHKIMLNRFYLEYSCLNSITT